jgi:succinylarginine dihydrolase
LAAANPRQRLTDGLYASLTGWAERRYRDRLSIDDLGDPRLLDESRAALDELTGLLGLGSGFYPFQRAGAA